ncbi:MAG: hypothetical protein Q8R26_02425, partial [bacterium]|nr:hypothetical protein [bacterium]
MTSAQPSSPAPEQVRYGTSLFARPSDWISEFTVRIFFKKSSDFNQKAQQILYKSQFWEEVASALRAA